jgi:sulfite exporter TauE/SafE
MSQNIKSSVVVIRIIIGKRHCIGLCGPYIATSIEDTVYYCDQVASYIRESG